MSRFVIPGDAVQVAWRDGFVQKELLEAVNDALDAGDLDSEERVALASQRFLNNSA